MQVQALHPASVEPATDILTFLIADVRGYTRFTVEQGDEAAAELAMKFAALAREAVTARGGELLELRGDEALAVFTSTQDALRAAVELQAQLIRETEADPDLPLRAGVGVAAGKAVPVEGGFRGVALNLAARLCSLAGPGEVLTSDAVAQLVSESNGVSYIQRGPVELKGFIDPIPVVQVAAGTAAADGRAAGAPGARTSIGLPIGVYLGSLPSGPIVAREEELTAIQAAMDTVVEGTGQVVLLAGRRGIGRTRLAQEATLAAHKRGFLIATGRCYDAQQGRPYFPFMEALGQAYDAAPASIRFQVPRRWPHLAHLLPDRLAPPTPDPSASPEEEEERLIRAVGGFLSALTLERIVAVLLDDLHFADEASLRLLVHLARHTRTRRLFLLATYRDTELAHDAPFARTLRDLGRERLADRIVLRQLSAEGTAAMVAALVGDMQVTEEFEAFVHRRTKGVPLFVEEIVRSLGGRYRLVREIGAGGMGRVFQAVDRDTGEQVAAKIMFASREAGADGTRRFQQEGAVLAELQHPNIVRVHGTFIEEHASCIVMELLAGRSLAETLHDERLGLGRVKQIALQVAAALAFAHKRGIVHRDIKPDNIMVVEGDQVKVTDFGIARVLRPEATIHTMTSTGVALGTPLYMAPEQVEGREVDERADVYALGAVMYHMVTGRPPFEGSDPLTIAFKHVNEAPQPPSEINPRIPQDWDEVILKALAKDPAQRYATAGAIQRALAELSVPAADDETAVPAAEARRGGLLRFGPVPLAAGGLVLATGVAYGALTLGSHSTAHAAIGAPVAGWGAQPKIGKFSYLYGVAADGAGNVYVTDQLKNRVVKMSPRGQPLTTWGSSGAGLGQFTQAGTLAVDSKGNTYVVDNQSNRVEEFGPDGTPLASFGGTGSGPGQLNGPQAVTVDGRGRIYVADTGNDRVEEFFASGKAGRTFARFPALPNEPPGPAGVATDPAGNVYVSVGQKNVIQKFSPRGTLLATISGPGTADGELAGPGQLAVDAKGNIYVFDQGNRLQEFSSSGQWLRTLAPVTGPAAFNNPTALVARTSGDLYVGEAGKDRIVKLASGGRSFAPWGDQTASPPRLNEPNGVAVDGQGYVYVADTANNRMWQLSPAGRLLALNAGAGSGPGTLSSPSGVAADAQGDTYVADSGNNRIAVFSAARRQWSTLVGSSLLNAPYGVTVDQKGNVYVADTGNQQVHELSPRGKVLHTWGTLGSAGISLGQFHDPYAVAVDGQGNLYVADELNNRIQELPANSQSWTILSTGSLRLNAPTGVAVDGRGNVDVVDSGHNRIVELSPGGTVLGTVGVAGSGPGQFSGPTAIAFDSRGNAYVTDTGNNRIQKFAPRP